MFDLSNNERLNEWKKFRDQLETSEDPYLEVLGLWIRAPFVNDYLDPKNPSDWPDPWHLVLDNRLDNLAIILGMLYTFKLTRRFMDAYCEIHMSIGSEDPRYFLVVDSRVLNYVYGSVSEFSEIKELNSEIVWAGKSLP